MGLELVVFDMAGTTVEDDGAVAWALAFALESAAHVRVARDAVDRVMGLAKPVAIEALLRRARGVAPDTCEVRRVHGVFEDTMVRHYATGPDVRAIDGAAECLSALRARGVRVALDTGFGRRIAEAVLARLRWRVGESIDALVASDDVPHGRPHPDMIERAMTLVGVTEHAAVAKVGDTPVDVAEGLAANVGLVVAVTSGAHGAKELTSAGASHVIGSVRELVGLFDALGVLPPSARAVA